MQKHFMDLKCFFYVGTIIYEIINGIHGYVKGYI